MKISLLLAVLFCAGNAFAQTGTLRGGKMVLSNGSAAVTMQMPGSPQTWTLTWPVDTSNGVQFLYMSTGGVLNWGVPASATSTGTVLYNLSGPQTLTNLGVDLFNIGYATSDPGPALGALIKVVGNGGSNTTMTGLTDTARNIKSSNGVSGLVQALVDTVGNAGSGTQTGLKVTVSGSGTNYAGLFSGGNIGINSSAPTEVVEVSGNARISGVKGLKITEGTNGTMGTVVMNGVNAVVVSTTKVTANSRILLTPQNTGGCNCVGMPYVSARTASTSFSVKSTAAGDNSTVAWILIEP